MAEGEGIQVRVLFFAKARELVKFSEATISLKEHSLTPRNLFEEILNHWPNLRPLQNCMILARNQAYLDLDSETEVQLVVGDEIAVIPPISSGRSQFTLLPYSLLGYY